MSNTVTFYYSRRKLGIYLLLNMILLALAGLFTWAVFPDYSIIYGYAIITCAISLLASLIVFIFPMKLATIDDDKIKIDHNEPLLWSQVKSVEKDGLVCCGINRSIIRINPQKLSHYHKSLMQKITDSSRFGMFSIPLYAMDEKSAAEITRLIDKHVKGLQKPNKKAKSAEPMRKNKTKKTSSVTKKRRQKSR